MKKCNECGIERPVECFDKHKGNNDGRVGYCKECRKYKASIYREKNRTRIRLKENEYRKKYPEKRKVLSDRSRSNNRDKINLKDRIYYLNLSEEKKEKRREAKRKFDKSEKGKEYNRIYRIKKAEIIKSRWELNNAIRDGKIERGKNCMTCLSIENIEAHHIDYKKPLDVIWLCKQCHTGLHKSLNRRKK